MINTVYHGGHLTCLNRRGSAFQSVKVGGF